MLLLLSLRKLPLLPLATNLYIPSKKQNCNMPQLHVMHPIIWVALLHSALLHSLFIYNQYSPVVECDFWKCVNKTLRWRGHENFGCWQHIYIYIYQTSFSIMHSDKSNMAHAYNNGCITEIMRNIIQHTTLKASIQGSDVLAVKVWLTS
jgi:hypothetical protein